MLYEVYFNDSEVSTLAGYFEVPGTIEEAQACVAVLEQVLLCLERGIFQSASLFRDGIFIQKFQSPVDVEQIRALPRDDLNQLIAKMTKQRK